MAMASLSWRHIKGAPELHGHGSFHCRAVQAPPRRCTHPATPARPPIDGGIDWHTHTRACWLALPNPARAHRSVTHQSARSSRKIIDGQRSGTGAARRRGDRRGKGAARRKIRERAPLSSSGFVLVGVGPPTAGVPCRARLCGAGWGTRVVLRFAFYHRRPFSFASVSLSLPVWAAYDADREKRGRGIRRPCLKGPTSVRVPAVRSATSRSSRPRELSLSTG